MRLWIRKQQPCPAQWINSLRVRYGQNCRSTLLFVPKQAQDPSKVLSKARLFAPTGAQTKHGNARTESPNIWLPEPPAVHRCAASSGGRTSQSETALR